MNAPLAPPNLDPCVLCDSPIGIVERKWTDGMYEHRWECSNGHLAMTVTEYEYQLDDKGE